jgi:hypothetical protein
MRKLTPQEERALFVLATHGSFCPGMEMRNPALMKVLDGLVKKKRATVEMTDDGPRYSLTSLGAEEAV